MLFSVQVHLYNNLEFADNIIDENDDDTTADKKKNMPIVARAKGLWPYLIEKNVMPFYQWSTNCM